ncbi:MAG TPA: NAD(P)/FAD-dependent oxidoreductase [Vicinamibacterales bacterium]|nr:NAD(P)/FAD-dependent oxidoreductase [Vicinamibacterales bacterium]
MIDAVVIGSGPNGLSAAITLAQAGCKVAVFEANATIGGGVRSAELTLPGFTHDVCSAVHPLGVASPFWNTLPLADYGLEWIVPPVMVAHPFDDGTAAATVLSLEATAATLGRDGRAYTRIVGDVVRDWPQISPAVLGPPAMPEHPLSLAKFGLRALRSARHLSMSAFRNEPARALLAGSAAHGMMPLNHALTAGIGLTLTALSHIGGWPIPRGGAQSITNALVKYLASLGGEVFTGAPVNDIDKLLPSRMILCDLSPRPLLRIAGHKFSRGYRRALARYRYGMGVFKVDWALDAPIPWTAETCRRAGTVHLGGTMKEIAASERDAWEGRIAERPFVLLSQPTLFDPSRAPADKHVAWAYCHVPSGSDVSMLERIEAQVERFAPGFRNRVLARSITTPRDLEANNANFVGGDIGAGVASLRQFFTRPTWRTYSTPAKGLYLCSASTPPGVGVHGMCGYWAAKLALSRA